MITTIWQTFALVFLMELGSKSQFTVVAVASNSDNRLAVWVGAALALIFSAGVASMFSKTISQIPHINLVSGMLLVFFGLYTIIK